MNFASLHTIVFAVVLSSTLGLRVTAQDASQGEVGCITCHGAEGKQHRGTIHDLAGISCTSCHGGDSTVLDQAQAHGDALAGLTSSMAAVESCGACHADPQRMGGYGARRDQLAHYWTSQHGQALAEDGDAKVATCVTCHGSHAVYPNTDPRAPAHKFRQVETCGACHSDAQAMEPYGLSSELVDEYRNSAHGRALLEESRLSSPACTDCHGSHGATPPRVEEVGRVCGKCHSVVQGYFEESPHFAVVQDGRMEECVDCHGSHAVTNPGEQTFAKPESGICSVCHEADSAAMGVAHELGAGLGTLRAGIDDIAQDLRVANSQGLFVDEERGYVADALSLRNRARSITHTLSTLAVSDVLNRGEGAVEQARTSVSVKRRALRDRKIFATILIAVCLLLAVVLQTYRREVYGSRSRGTS